jgi:hypothetical protein
MAKALLMLILLITGLFFVNDGFGLRLRLLIPHGGVGAVQLQELLMPEGNQKRSFRGQMLIEREGFTCRAR